MKIIITESQLNLLEKYITNNSNILMEQIWTRFLNSGKNLSKLTPKTSNAIKRIGQHLEFKGFGSADDVTKKLFSSLSNNFDETSKMFKFQGGVTLEPERMDKILGILSNEAADDVLKQRILDELQNFKLKNGNNLGDELKGIKSSKTSTTSKSTKTTTLGDAERIIEKQKILSKTKDLSQEERFAWYDKPENQNLFNQVFKTQDEIDSFFKVKDNPDWSAIKKLVKEYDPLKSGGKNFYSWMESNGYKFPDNFKNNLKKFTAEQQIRIINWLPTGLLNVKKYVT
jgi:hypothetical protein